MQTTGTLTVPAQTGVLANDISLGTCTGGVTLSVVKDPRFGQVTLNDDGSFVYVPDYPSDPDSDSFIYRAVCLPSGEYSYATVTLQGRARGGAGPGVH